MKKEVVVNKRLLNKKAKEFKKDSETRNVTFRIPNGLISTFKSKCEEKGLTMTEVIIQFMKEYNK